MRTAADRGKCSFISVGTGIYVKLTSWSVRTCPSDEHMSGRHPALLTSASDQLDSCTRRLLAWAFMAPISLARSNHEAYYSRP